MKGIVYKWTCNVNGKSYIGITTNEKHRENEFLNPNDAYTTNGSKIDNARKKYGLSEGTWTKTVLKRLWCKNGNEVNLKERLCYWETYFIAKYDTFTSGYNSTTGGEIKKEVCEISKEKISKNSLEQWNNYSLVTKKKKINELSKGSKQYHNRNKNHVTLEVSKKISEKQKEFHKTNPQINYKGISKVSKKVAKMDDNGKIIEIYSSIAEASLKNKIYKSGIRAVCCGKRKKCKGFLWKFIGEIKEYNSKNPKGYYWSNSLKRWHSRLKHKQKSYSLGYFKTEEAANEMYRIAKQHIFDNTFDKWYENILEEKYKLMKKMGEI